jgi:hypothetical protein
MSAESGSAKWTMTILFMANDTCLHVHTVRATLDCDTARAVQQRSRYSTQLELKVCDTRGHVENWRTRVPTYSAA